MKDASARTSRSIPNNKLAAPRSPVGSETIRVEAAAELSLELLDLTITDLADSEFRERLRKLAIRMGGGVGACHVVPDEHGQWDIQPNAASGRLPRLDDFPQRLGARCGEVATRGTVHIEALPELEGLTAVLAPVTQFGCIPEVFLLLLGKESDPRTSILAIQQIAAVLKLRLKSRSDSQNDWKLQSLATLIELVSRIEACTATSEAATLIANDSARHFNCPFVAVAAVKDGVIRHMAISGANPTDRRSQVHHGFRQALEESLLRKSLGVWPPADDANHLLLAHRQLASVLQCESLLSLPLATVDGRVVGSWLFAGPRALIHAQRMQRFVQAAAPRVAGALDVVQRAELPQPIRLLKCLPQQMARRQTLLALLCVGILLGMLAIPMPLRVRCHCTLMPIERRFAVAPYDGMIARGSVRPGDKVRSGDLLAEMDGRSLSLELASVGAERLKALKKQDIELADHNVSQLQLATLDARRLDADESLLHLRHDNLQIRSPMDGVVLSGSLERAEAASVRKGQILFEIGSAQVQRFELEIRAEEIAHVRIGHSVTIWVEGMEHRAIRETIERIRPSSELRNGQHVFVAEVSCQSPDVHQLRPGMRGSARIDGDFHPLGWNVFHRPYELLRSYLAW